MCMKKIEKDIVIVDNRFMDEIMSIKNNGGIIVCVKRNIELEDEHISEQIHKTYEADYVIENDGTLEDLYEKVDKLIETLKK